MKNKTIEEKNYEKNYLNGIEETFFYCIRRVEELEKSFSFLGKKDSEVCVLLGNIKKDFEHQMILWTSSIEQQMGGEL